MSTANRIAAFATLLGLAAYLGVAGCRSQGDSRDSTVSGYIKLLKSDDPKVRQDAANNLGKMRTTDSGAIDALGNAVRDKDPGVQAAAAKALAGIRTEKAMVKLKDSMQKLQSDGRTADRVKNAYDDGVEDLQDQAQKGDEQAKKTLERLKEPLERRDHGVKIEIK